MQHNAPLCRTSDLADHDSRGFDPFGEGRDTVLVVRQGDALFVYRDACPHYATPMAWRRHAYLDAARERIVCHAHGAQFDIASGVCVLGPCLGDRLQALPHRIDLDGNITLIPEHTL